MSTCSARERVRVFAVNSTRVCCKFKMGITVFAVIWTLIAVISFKSLYLLQFCILCLALEVCGSQRPIL